MMVSGNRVRKISLLALSLCALALLLSGAHTGAREQTNGPQTQSASQTKTTAPQQTPTPTPNPLTQEPPPPKPYVKPKPTPKPEDEAVDEGDVVRVNSNLVVVPVSVTDNAGQPVLGLKMQDFLLQEEGKKQEIAQMGDPEQVPLEIAVLLDVSGSVDARFDFERHAAASFLKQVLKPIDRATVFTIGQQPRLEQARDTAERASNKLVTLQPAKGPTAFFDTVIDAAHYLSQNTPPQHRRVILVISDGDDNYSEKIKKAIGATREEQEAVTVSAKQKIYNRAIAEVGREVQSADAVFYSINPSGDPLHINIAATRAQNGMEQLSEATGGSSFVPERIEDLEKVFRQITNELRSQYLLQYYSGDESPSGKFLRIKVAVPTRAELRIRARQGYYPKRK
ncbi:MAG: VWA domain-containing protein [Pyrinomonadaceae bacterium]